MFLQLNKLASFKQIWKILVRTTFFWRHKPSNMVWTSFSRNVHHIANWLIMDRWYHSKSRTISKDAAIIAYDSETSSHYQNLGERRSLIGTNVKRSQRWKMSTDEVIDTSFETIIFNKNHSCDKKFRSRDQHLSDQSERSPPPRKHVHQSHQRNFIDEEYDDVDQRDFFGLLGRNNQSAGPRREIINETSNRYANFHSSNVFTFYSYDCTW